MGQSQGTSSHCDETYRAAAQCCAIQLLTSMQLNCIDVSSASAHLPLGLACIEALLCCSLTSASTPSAQHWTWRRLTAELMMEEIGKLTSHYVSTPCRLTAELMMEEIGRRPTTTDSAGAQNGSVSHPDNREGYAWAAAMGLGLITLGRGRSAIGLADMRIEQRLRQAHITLPLVYGTIAAPPQRTSPVPCLLPGCCGMTSGLLI